MPSAQDDDKRSRCFNRSWYTCTENEWELLSTLITSNTSYPGVTDRCSCHGIRNAPSSQMWSRLLCGEAQRVRRMSLDKVIPYFAGLRLVKMTTHMRVLTQLARTTRQLLEVAMRCLAFVAHVRRIGIALPNTGELAVVGRVFHSRMSLVSMIPHRPHPVLLACGGMWRWCRPRLRPRDDCVPSELTVRVGPHRHTCVTGSSCIHMRFFSDSR